MVPCGGFDGLLYTSGPGPESGSEQKLSITSLNAVSSPVVLASALQVAAWFVTVMPDWKPVIDDFAVSVALSVHVPGTPNETPLNVWTPLSDPVNV